MSSINVYKDTTSADYLAAGENDRKAKKAGNTAQTNIAISGYLPAPTEVTVTTLAEVDPDTLEAASAIQVATDATLTGKATGQFYVAFDEDTPLNITFNGSTQYLQAANNTIYDITTQDFWMAGMFKRTSDSGAEERIADKFQLSPSLLGYTVVIQANDRLSCQVWENGNAATNSPAATISLNVWYAWALSADRDGNLVCYLYNMDTGTLSSDSASMSAVTASISNSLTFTVAARSSDQANKFAGNMDNLIPPQNGLLTQAQFLEYVSTGAVGGVEPTSVYHFEGNAKDGYGRRDLTENATPTYSESDHGIDSPLEVSFGDVG